MGRVFVYMNEAIREEEPSKPVIVVQRAGKLTNTNRVLLKVAGKIVGRIRFSKTGLKAAPQHRVRAWVELDGVEVVPE